MRKSGNQVTVTHSRPRSRRSENARGRTRTVITTRDGEFASLLAIAIEAIAGRDTICEGGKTARERKRANRETERRTMARWLGLSSIGRARVESTRKSRRERMGPLMPAIDEAMRGIFYLSRVIKTSILRVGLVENEREQ